ncbi:MULTISPECIES: carboxylesterase [unclassified Erwinia]|uniref:alpha/beta hydrolase n=1 Tax=unclassified Erwinia TaxID=2622719 RepID=UPI0007005C97|nr:MULTISPECIES: alpha/beta fold hydrolase [unclassified Erwinia]KQN54292.1 alpha/beta hydrolase [Erwinia sp. Leaf53]
MTAKHDYWLPGGPVGVLLVHGLTGTPQEMRGVARAFNQAGYTVYVPQLAGHCGTPEDLVNSGWRDWYQSVITGAEALSARVDRLFIGGLSMGAVLALNYAADYPQRVSGVLVYSITLRYDGWSIPVLSRLASRWLLPFTGWLRLGRKRIFYETPPYGIRNEVLRRKIAAKMFSGDSVAAGLPGNPWPALNEMSRLSRHLRRHLYRVTSPCLILHAAEDDISHRRNAEWVRDRVSGPAELVLLANSYHMITIDNDRSEVFRRSTDFVRQQSAPPLQPDCRWISQAGGAG